MGKEEEDETIIALELWGTRGGEIGSKARYGMDTAYWITEIIQIFACSVLSINTVERM